MQSGVAGVVGPPRDELVIPHTGVLERRCRSRAGWTEVLGAAFAGATLLLAAPLDAQLEVPAGARTVNLGELPAQKAALVGSPIYRLGWAGQRDFQAVYSGVLLPDGSAAVLDLRACEMVVVDPVGTIRAVIGRKGEGPGEFKYPLSVTRKAGDTLVVEDDGNVRMSYFFEGELVRDERYATFDMVRSYAAARWEGEGLYWTRWAVPSPLPDDSTHLAVMRSNSASSALDTVVAYRSIPTPRPPLSTPFRNSGRVGLTAGAVVTAWPNQPEFVRFPLEGAPPLHVVWAEDPPTLTDSIWNEHVAYEQSRFGGRNAELRIGRRAAVDGPLPLIGHVRGDPLGRIWVSRWSPVDNSTNGTAGPYRVFGPDGAWLGWVELPFRMRILDIGADRILAVQKDEFDVEAVVVLPLLPSLPGR